MIHIVDDANLEGLATLGCCGSGSGRSSGRCSHGAGSGTAAAGECQCRNGGSSHSGLEEAAAGDHGNVFHNSKLLSRSGRQSKRPAPFAGRVLQTKTTLSLCVIHKDRIGKVRFCGATLLALLCKLQSLTESQHSLSCNGDFRPKLLRLAAHLPGPRRPTKALPRSRPFSLSGLTEDALCRFSSASSV